MGMVRHNANRRIDSTHLFIHQAPAFILQELDINGLQK